MRNRTQPPSGAGRSGLLAALLALQLGGMPAGVRASDHDDGETDTKSRNTNLTDLYVFREGDQTGNPADNANLILVMNTNPRSLARQHYYFNPNARYEFHVTRVTDRDAAATGVEDLVLRFSFGAPTAGNQQAISLTLVNVSGGGSETTVDAGFTTPAGPGIGFPGPLANAVSLAGHGMTVFAGLREDPFFFDVEQTFRVRAALLGKGPAVGFRSLDDSVDFARGYNVNAIVARVPIALLQQGSGVTTFDVWETISVAK